MFEFFFKYSWLAYKKGSFVLASGWPAWGLLAACAAVAAFVAWRSLGAAPTRRRAGLSGMMQWASIALLLLMLWRPALSVTELKPQQNVVTVIVDASASMQLEDRIGQARRMLEGGLLSELKKKYPVRLYQAGRELQRIDAPPTTASEPVTDLGEALRGAAAESSTLPVGAIVLLSDGADNLGGLDAATMESVSRARIPVLTVGFGSERIGKDIEIAGAAIPARVLPGARLSAVVTLRQAGFAGQPARLSVKEDSKTLSSREIRLPADGETSRESLVFAAGQAGARALRVEVTPLEGETNRRNNAVTRLVDVGNRKPRVLYIEGEPRWELKFIRRAIEEDGNLELVSILRTTENKFYRQGIGQQDELEHGFPATVEELFAYQGLIVGNVEAGYFNATQIALIREFAERRGGGVLFLGGRAALADGGWAGSDLAAMMPVTLPAHKATFHRDPAVVELSEAGAGHLLTRLEDNPELNRARWKSLPYLADWQELGEAKPGALVLVEAVAGGRGRSPLLVTQNYGRGHVAVFASGGSWRWQMAQDAKDQSHEVFWRQMLRWLAGDVGGRVRLETTESVYSDRSLVRFRAEVRDQNYLPASDAVVEVQVMGPAGGRAVVQLSPSPGAPGVYEGDWRAVREGAYLAEASARQGESELGRETASFRREDGVAENFRTEQNRELLERISTLTRGRYFKPDEVNDLPREVELSDAGITVKRAAEIWDSPAAFFLLVALKSAEWFVRRRWGAV